MNWKNVLYLVRVERKSGRLIRGIKATHYRERGIFAYWPYWAAVLIGVSGGLLANFIASLVYADGTLTGLPELAPATIGFFVSLPTLILIGSLVLTMLQQIQVSGVKATTQVMYWLPVTWQENTLASILANLLGFPIAIVLGFSSGVLVFSAFNGLMVEALLTTLALFGAAFMGSATMEVLRVLQTRFVGAIYKSSGRAAVWVRLVGSLLFFLLFYVLYFGVVYGFTSFIQGLSQFQITFWFIPFVWLGVMLYYLLNGAFVLGIVFVVCSVLFLAGLYYLATLLNMRFGLYEPPAIRVQTSGVYAPKTGLLGKLGFSSVEAAIIRKDTRAFTRRRELISIFIVPIVFILIPIMQSVGISSGGSQEPAQVAFIFTAMTFLFPPAVMAMSVGSLLIGEEGQAVWRIYASPISAKNLVKSKLFFLNVLSIVILLITGPFAIIFYHPSLNFIITAFVEGFFLIFALGTISLCIGFKGADFSQTRRARMVRQSWSLINLAACGVAGLAILAPLAPYAITLLVGPSVMPFGPVTTLGLAIALAISGIIAAVITAVFYRIDIGSAKELLRKAEI